MRSTSATTAQRAFGFLTRAVITKSNDTTKRQELDLQLLYGETQTGVERFQQYGFSSVPVAPTDEPQSGGSSKKTFAGALVAFLTADRSHPVVLAVDDKRYRPNNLNPGESVLHDHQGQVVHVSKSGIVLRGGTETNNDQSTDKKLPVTIQVGSNTHIFSNDDLTVTYGNASFVVKDGTISATVGGMSVTISASRIDLGGIGGPAVMTASGPSSKVFAIV
jgi:phage gp45-like